jgi:pSer/pThr/pTyr-binding forkhead associated (FHA) protein
MVQLPLLRYLSLLETGRLLKTVDVPVLVWNTSSEESQRTTHEFTQPIEIPTTDSAKRAPNVVVFEMHAGSAEDVSLLVGRSSTCDIRLEDGSVPRKHAEFKRSGREWTVCDLGTTNGTWLGPSRLEPLASVTLTDGARVQLGKIEVLFMFPPSFEQYLRQVAARQSQ